MQQTIIMKNLKSIYYTNGVLEKDISPFFLSFLLYDSKKQFDKDKESRKELLNNTLQGISDLRWIMNSQGYYAISQYAAIEFEFYFDFCKELVEVIIDKKWKSNITLNSLEIIADSSISRRVVGDGFKPWLLKNVSVMGVKTPNTPEGFKLINELKQYAAQLDKKYNKYVVDDII